MFAKRQRLIPVLPKNYRRVALLAISVAHHPVVIMSDERIIDFSEDGPLTQKKIAACRNFEIRDDNEPILGFHDHPSQMWIASSYIWLAKECECNGWLKIQ